MKRKQLIELIAGGETLHCEFKLKFSTAEKIAKECMAFANTSGGVLIFGVDDEGTVVGVASEKTESELLREAAEFYCQPKIDYSLSFIQVDGKELVVVKIPESKNKPHRLQDYQEDLDIRTAKVYVRVNDKSIQASKELIKLLKHESAGSGLKHYQIGSLEKQIFTLLEKEEYVTVRRVAETFNISNRRASRTMINLSRAGLLLYHTHAHGDDTFSIKL